MARHLLVTDRPDLLTSAFEVLRNLANRVADHISYWRFRNTAVFGCELCDVTRVPTGTSGAELRHARELATDHSRHGSYAGATTVYGA